MVNVWTGSWTDVQTGWWTSVTCDGNSLNFSDESLNMKTDFRPNQFGDQSWYSGSLKIRTRMCKGFWWKSGFFGKVLFGKNAKVRIFWTSPVLRKDKSPDFLEKCHFPKTQNYEFCTKTLDKLIWKHLHLNPEEKKHVAKMIDTGATLAEVDKWYQMRFGKKFLKKIPCRPIHMSGFLGQALFGKNGKVRIFWTSPVWQKHKSPDFLESGF